MVKLILLLWFFFLFCNWRLKSEWTLKGGELEGKCDNNALFKKWKERKSERAIWKNDFRENLEGKLDKKERKDYIKKGIIAK